MPLTPNNAEDGKEDWRTIVPSQDIELIVRDQSSVIVSFEELEVAELLAGDLPYHRFVPVPQDFGNDCPFVGCKMQFGAIAGG